VLAQVLNREFVEQAAALVRNDLERELAARAGGSGRRGLSSEVDELDDDAVGEMVAALGEATQGGEPDAVAGREVPAVQEGAPPQDDFAFIPRDATLSWVQTAIEDHVEQNVEVEVEDSPLLDERRAGDVPVVTDRRIAEIPITRTAAGRRIGGDMEIHKFLLFSDPGWLTSGFAMGVRFFRGRAKWVEKPPTVPIADKAKIVLVGDWGSGLRRAKNVSDRIREVLAEDERVQRHVVHLGDVYYSGSKREYERNFLNLWPVHDGEDVGSYSLCGNHDMYYGGHAYYGTCLADPRFARQGGCSYFALENEHWKLLGLDTGHEDGGLEGDQAAWAREQVLDSPDRKVALLTHHQLFSAHEPGAKRLGKKIEPVLATNRVDAWFWGHEHRCIQYDATEWNGHRVGFASCLGHGGVPEYLAMKEGERKPAPWAYEYLTPFDADQPWETFGFAVLELDGPEMKVRYIDENGKEHHRFPLETG
jgi:Calcineurin-like phosphoesterase